MNNNEKSSKEMFFSKWGKTMIIIAFSTIMFSFIAPYLFTNYSLINLPDNGNIGNTIGGIMSPFIAIAGVIFTFLAFYMQFEANRLQRENFQIQLNENKKQLKKELSIQSLQFAKTRFENQFYEMLRLHKENVNEITITFENFQYASAEPFLVKNNFKGREAFQKYLEEIKLIYYTAKKIYKNESPDFLINVSYSVFFHGINNYNLSKKPNGNNKNEINFYIFINNLKKIKLNINYYGNYVDNSKLIKINLLGSYIFEGYSSYLAHYYRHLYQTVKFIVKKNNHILNYEDKRNYLRILRAQLSNQEQAMLFYNWKSDFGRNWENNENHFFTDYRMIHNLYNDLLIPDFDLEKIFDIKSKKYLKEKNRKNDPLFEFEDWKNAPSL